MYCHGNQVVDISNPGVRDKPSRAFGMLPGNKEGSSLEPDGFPQIGTLLQEGDPYYRCLMNTYLQI